MSRGRPTRCRASGGRSPAGRWLRPDRCSQCGTPCGRCGSDDPGRPGSGSRGPAGCAAAGRCCLWQCPDAATAGSGCNRCRSGCTAPEYPGPGPGNGGHLRKAWVSLPFLIYRASERHSDQVGKTTKVFRCVPHRNPENTGCVRISGYIGTCVPISEQKLCAFWFGRLKTAGRPPFFRRPERRRSLPFARDADTFGACDGIVGQLNKLQTIKNKRNIVAFERDL